MENIQQNASNVVEDQSDQQPGPVADPMVWLPVIESETSTTRNNNNGNVLWRRRAVPNRILLVHGLKKIPVNCDMIFNLFRLYGNVRTVKVLKSRGVLVEMGDIEAAKRCVKNLHLLSLDNIFQMKVCYTRIKFFNDSGESDTLADGSAVRKNYRSSRFNIYGQGEAPTRRIEQSRALKVMRTFGISIDLDAETIENKTVTNAVRPTTATRWSSFVPTLFDFVGKLLLAAIVSYLFLYRAPEVQPPGATMCSIGIVETKSIESAADAVLLLNPSTTFDPSAAGSTTEHPIGGHPYAESGPDSSPLQDTRQKQWSDDQDDRNEEHAAVGLRRSATDADRIASVALTMM